MALVLGFITHCFSSCVIEESANALQEALDAVAQVRCQIFDDTHCLKPRWRRVSESEDTKRVAADIEFAKQKQLLVEAEKAALGQSIVSRRASDSEAYSFCVGGLAGQLFRLRLTLERCPPGLHGRALYRLPAQSLSFELHCLGEQ